MIEVGSAQTFFNKAEAIPSLSRIREIKKCSHSIAGLPSLTHNPWAFEKASCSFMVICSKCIIIPHQKFISFLTSDKIKNISSQGVKNKEISNYLNAK